MAPAALTSGRRYILWGNAGHAKVLAGTIRLLGGRVVALFDNAEGGDPVLPGVPLFHGEEGFARWRATEPADARDLFGLAAIGGGRGRDRLAIERMLSARGVRVEPLVHPDASVDATAALGPGTQVLAQSVVAADAKLGASCVLNHRASVDHECVLGDGVHLAPAATLCGLVTLGENVFVAAGAVVLPRVAIGADTVVGAGAVVTRDLPPGVVAYGNPARVVRTVGA